MRYLHNIGNLDNPNYTPLEKILECNEAISFDGVYRSVYENRHKLKGKQITLFILGDWVGGDNHLDTGMPLERMCSWKEIEELVKELHCDIGWHTWTHRDLTTLSDEELDRELTPEIPMDLFAYPYGNYDDRVIEAVSKKFKKAYGTESADDETLLTLKRTSI